MTIRSTEAELERQRERVANYFERMAKVREVLKLTKLDSVNLRRNELYLKKLYAMPGPLDEAVFEGVEHFTQVWEKKVEQQTG